MNSSPAHVCEEKKRDLLKCTTCRRKKIKCRPQGRDWVNEHQKCDNCAAHDEVCGPNYKNKDDPEVIGRGTRGESTQEQGSGQESVHDLLIGAALEQRVADTPNANDIASAPGQLPCLSDGSQSKPPALSVEQLGEKALVDLGKLNSLGVTLTSLQSQPVFNHDSCRCLPDPHNIMFSKAKLHHLFISIYKLGVQAYEEQLYHQARWILHALLFALDRYQILRDDQKRRPLLRMAKIFQDLGLPWESERVLEMMTQLNSPSAPAVNEDPCLWLAESLPKTSETIRCVLTTLWIAAMGDDDLPTRLLLPPLQRAAAIANPGVTSALLAHQNGVYPRPKELDNRYHRVAAFLGTPQIQARHGIDDPDLHARTALFVAASHGFDQCCLALLSGLANPNSRDYRGHTVLEVAARGGHLGVAKLLIGVGAIVDPILSFCSSSPLQAALEGEHPNKELVNYLLDRGASIISPRLSDNRTALEIASSKGHTELANAMRQRTPVQSLYPFSLGNQDLTNQSLDAPNQGHQDFQYP